MLYVPGFLNIGGASTVAILSNQTCKTTHVQHANHDFKCQTCTWPHMTHLETPALSIASTLYIEAICSVGPGGNVIRPRTGFSAGKADLLPRGGLCGHQEAHKAPGGQGRKSSPGLISEKVRVRAEACSGRVGKPFRSKVKALSYHSTSRKLYTSTSVKEERHPNHPRASRQPKDTERGQKLPGKHHIDKEMFHAVALLLT